MIRLLTRNKGCISDDCENDWYARGLCRTHYQRAYKQGRLDEFPIHPFDASASSVDETALEEACAGEPVALTTYERRVAVTRLYERGCSDARIAYLLHVSERTVLRYRRHLGLPGLPMARIVEMQRAA